MNIQNVHLLLVTSSALNIYILSSHFACRRLSKSRLKTPQAQKISKFSHLFHPLLSC